MKLSLVVTQGSSQGKLIPIALSQFLIGRDAQCHLRPASPLISKRHCALLTRGGKAFVRDFDSTNGTFVNDQQVKGEVELHNDDQLKLGPLAFGIRLEAGQPAAKAAAKSAGKPGAVDDDSVAAMLMELQGEESAIPQIIGDGGEESSSNTVLMQLPKQEKEAGKPADKKGQPPKPELGNTSNAAKAILEKYSRRTRK
ncbi:MAG TPA: FHA domain-containing protein [Gemmataceae bacterium]|jgi:pSer/pThr/pTyr-binding forkhead associated (FHA) protein|nr:FHA domain-containing protein [Gemmataceae bacterium]